jgi:hypothetical protein
MIAASTSTIREVVTHPTVRGTANRQDAVEASPTLTLPRMTVTGTSATGAGGGAALLAGSAGIWLFYVRINSKTATGPSS